MQRKQENAQTNLYQENKKDNAIKENKKSSPEEELPAITENSNGGYATESLKNRDSEAKFGAKSQADAKEVSAGQADNFSGNVRLVTDPEQKVPGALAGHEDEVERSETN